MHDIHAICIQLGDLKAMERLRRTLKPGGYCLLAVPVGADAIVWNAHRKYGRLRLPVLFHRWSLVAQFGLTRQILDDPNVNTHIQPVFVIKNEYERAGGVGGKDERDGDSGDEEVRSGLREASLLSDSIDWDTVLTSKPVDGTPALPRERNCLPQAAQGSTWMQCFFCPGDEFLSGPIRPPRTLWPSMPVQTRIRVRRFLSSMAASEQSFRVRLERSWFLKCGTRLIGKCSSNHHIMQGA